MTRAVAATALACSVLAFVLPFGAVSSCSGAEVRFTGVELATYSVSGESSSDEELASEVEGGASPFAMVVLASAGVGLVLLALGVSGAGICVWLGLAAMQLLLYAIVGASDGSELFVGYWLSLLAFLVAGFLCLMDWIRSRWRRGLSAWVPLSWTLAVALPPLGLVVSAVLAGAVWATRRVAAVWRRRDTATA